MFSWKKKLTNVVDDKVIQYKFNKTTEKKFMSIGLIGTLGIILIIFGIFTTLHSNHVEFKYSSVETTSKQGLNILSQRVNNNHTTLVLFRNDCKYCLKVEDHLVKKIVDMKEKGEEQFVVLDLKKFSNNQLNELRALVPEVVEKDNKIRTPLVADLRGNGHNFEIDKKNTDTNTKKIDYVLTEREER